MSNCPWSSFVPDPFPFCEEQLCQLIREPANTWTNIGYFVVGYLLFRAKNFHFAAAAIFLGVGSSLFHMSGTFWAKQIDLAGMLAFSAVMVAMHFKHRNLVAVSLLAATVPLIGYGRSGTYIFLFELLLVVLLQTRRQLSKEQKAIAIKVLLIFPIALGINILDQRKILCIPSNHIFTAHGLWHLLCAYCMYLGGHYFLYPYTQARDAKVKP